MTRTKLMTAATALLITAPGFALAESPQASTGTGTEVGSQRMSQPYMSDSPALNGFAEIDPTTIGMDEEFYNALLESPGKEIQTTMGETVGVIENVDVNAQGNPEMVVDIVNQSEIPAEVLVVTVQPGNVALNNGVLFLETSVDELEQKARYNSGRDSDDRVSVTLF